MYEYVTWKYRVYYACVSRQKRLWYDEYVIGVCMYVRTYICRYVCMYVCKKSNGPHWPAGRQFIMHGL
jgi:hypothetical protein